MKVEVSLVKKIREKTGLPVMECKKALEEALGNTEKALEILKKKGMEIALKKGKRETSEGLIFSYVHSTGKIGVLLELNCETDFVAKNDDFKELAKNLALQITAMSPLTVDRKGLSPETIKEKEKWWNEEFSDKPQPIRKKIREGKLNDFYREKVILEQIFIKDEKLIIHYYFRSVIAKLGENISIKRFVRYELGE